MADYDCLMYPEHWLDRAQESRAMARNASEVQARQHFLKVARGYERLAARAEAWKAAREAVDLTKG